MRLSWNGSGGKGGGCLLLKKGGKGKSFVREGGMVRLARRSFVHCGLALGGLWWVCVDAGPMVEARRSYE